MLRYALAFGAPAGIAVIAVMSAFFHVFEPADMKGAEVFGFATMIAILALIFVGVKRYRDQELGGVGGFPRLFAAGAAMAGVAGLFYALGWEIYQQATDFAFTDIYAEALRADIAAKDLAPADAARELAEIESYLEMQRNPLVRFAISLLEIVPVALLVALVSALILKNPARLPGDKVAA